MIRLAMDRTRGIVRDLRRLTFALEPITLRDHGFSAAFGELAGQTADAHRIDVAVDAEIVDDLERPIQVCLYRIAQEALANTVKHAGASHVSVRAHRRRDGSVEFAIADDGSGHVARAARPAGSPPGGRRDARARLGHRGDAALRADARRRHDRARDRPAPGRGATGCCLRSASAAPPPRRASTMNALPATRNTTAGDDLVQPQRPDLVRGIDPQPFHEEAPGRVEREVQAEQRSARRAASRRAATRTGRRLRRAGTRATRTGTSAGRSRTACSRPGGSAARSRGAQGSFVGPPKSSWLK